MEEGISWDDIVASQRKEKKELLAEIQRMKHRVPKGDKKKKKEINSEVAQLLADLNLKHEKELKDFESRNATSLSIRFKESCDKEFPKESAAEVSHVELANLPPDSSVLTSESEISQPFQRLSKAQKRRNKKAQMEKERIKAIAEQELENRSGERHFESEEIKKKLHERQLKIHEVPSDGNCLYRAVQHQLSTLRLQETTVESLRKLASEYLLSHKEEYLPFVTNVDTGNALTEEQYVKYCEDVAKTSTWGGHIEIQALSHVCGVPIEVIQAEGPSIVAGDENSIPRLILSYHRYIYGLGEHYNSVVSCIINN